VHRGSTKLKINTTTLSTIFIGVGKRIEVMLHILFSMCNSFFYTRSIHGVIIIKKTYAIKFRNKLKLAFFI